MKIKIKYKICKKCGRAIRHGAYCGFGFAYHPLCYAAIYGWNED